MANNSMAGVRRWLRTYPLIKSGKRINVNYLGSQPLEYVVEDVPTSPVIESYIDGSSLRAKSYVIASRDSCGSDAAENLVVSGFWDNLIAWIEEQDEIGNYPDIGFPVESVAVTNTGYVFELDGTVARYQIQIQLTYFRR